MQVTEDQVFQEVMLPLLARRNSIDFSPLDTTQEEELVRALNDPSQTEAGLHQLMEIGPAAATDKILEVLVRVMQRAETLHTIQACLKAVGHIGNAAIKSQPLSEALAAAIRIDDIETRKLGCLITATLRWTQLAPDKGKIALQEALLMVVRTPSSGEFAARWALTALVGVKGDPVVQGQLEEAVAVWPEDSIVRVEARSLLTTSPTVVDLAATIWENRRVATPYAVSGMALDAQQSRHELPGWPDGPLVGEPTVLGEFTIEYFQAYDYSYWARITAPIGESGRLVSYAMSQDSSASRRSLVWLYHDLTPPVAAGYVPLNTASVEFDALEFLPAGFATSEEVELLVAALNEPRLYFWDNIGTGWLNVIKSLPRYLERHLVTALQTENALLNKIDVSRSTGPGGVWRNAFVNAQPKWEWPIIIALRLGRHNQTLPEGNVTFDFTDKILHIRYRTTQRPLPGQIIQFLVLTPGRGSEHHREHGRIQEVVTFMSWPEGEQPRFGCDVTLKLNGLTEEEALLGISAPRTLLLASERAVYNIGIRFATARHDGQLTGSYRGEDVISGAGPRGSGAIIPQDAVLREMQRFSQQEINVVLYRDQEIGTLYLQATATHSGPLGKLAIFTVAVTEPGKDEKTRAGWIWEEAHRFTEQGDAGAVVWQVTFANGTLPGENISGYLCLRLLSQVEERPQ